MSTTKTRRIWIALVAAIAALALGFSLSGCAGESDEELITKAIDEEMSIIVEPDDETISMLAEEATSGAGSPLTLWASIARNWLSLGLMVLVTPLVPLR